MVVNNYPPGTALANQEELHKNTRQETQEKDFLKCYRSPNIHQRYQSLVCRMPKAEAARLENTQYLENEGISLPASHTLNYSLKAPIVLALKYRGIAWVR